MIIMLEKEFNIPGEIKCVLKYLSDPNTIKDIEPGNEINILLAVCYPENIPLTSNQIDNYSKEVVNIILGELSNLEKENPDFYEHFDINYNRPHFGIKSGNYPNRYTKFELKPHVKIKSK